MGESEMAIAALSNIEGSGTESVANRSIEPQLIGRERRQSEQAIAYWQNKIDQLGKTPTVAALDLAEMNTPSWSHRFVIAIDPVVENSALLLYGSDFARLLNLPEKSVPHVPMTRQLPKHFTDVFKRACSDAHQSAGPVRIEGEVR